MQLLPRVCHLRADKALRRLQRPKGAGRVYSRCLEEMHEGTALQKLRQQAEGVLDLLHVSGSERHRCVSGVDGVARQPCPKWQASVRRMSAEEAAAEQPGACGCDGTSLAQAGDRAETHASRGGSLVGN